MKQTLKIQRAIAEHLISTLDSLSPLRVLGRGYSITWRSSTGAVLKDASEVSPGEPVAVRLASGGLACTVEETYAKAEDISSQS
jgi:exodeoxyribonuclease VII large subunit